MTRRTDYLHPLDRDELEFLAEQSKKLHHIDWRWALGVIVASASAFVLFGEASNAMAAAMVLPFGGCDCAAGKVRCDCVPMQQKNGGAVVDTDQLLAMGSMTGPHRKTRPVTLSVWTRFVRCVRGLL